MKRKNFKIYLPLGLAVVGLVFSCSKSFLEKDPIGSYTPDVIATKSGVEGLLIGAYSLLDGKGGAGTATPGGGDWVTTPSNWVYGGVMSDDAHKGSDPGDQPDVVSLMTWSETSTNIYNWGKWEWGYDGVQRSNEVLRAMRLAEGLDPADTLLWSAQAKFLRAFYMLDLKKIFGNVPYVDESVTYSLGNWRVPNSANVSANNAEVWPKIEADLQYAVANLPESWPQAVGRANKSAAKAFLAKVYMFQQKYSDALPILNDLMANGKNSHGDKYALTTTFYENFNAATKNNTETVFATQNSVNDGSTAANANPGDVLNFSYDPAQPVSCCGFYQPSYSLVNAYKTTALGYADPDHYNDANFKNDQGIKSTDPFTPDGVQTLDPRLDWTTGRRGIPYLDWGIMPGFIFIRNQASGGPYQSIKNAARKSQVGTLTDKSSWTAGYTALNINLLRYADVILWAAECEVEVGSLPNALALVNQIRARAANPDGFVHTYIDNAHPETGFTTTPAANYKISQYPAGFFTDQDVARKYVRFERRLELAMEGHRFFDLVRYGTADVDLNAYVQKEVSYGYSLLAGAVFTKNDDNYIAIPQYEIDASTEGGTATLTQNPGK